MSIVFLSFGSNVGDRFFYLQKAKFEIEKFTKILATSSIYESEPFGNFNQSKFLNCILKIETSLKPLILLNKIKSIEKKIGRIERDKWMEREIDIDIIFYENLVFQNELLSIPHKEMQNRSFVVYPMCEIEKKFIHPVFKKNMDELSNEIKNLLDICKIKSLKL